ncbi:MAG: hypothetical protein AABX51_03890 [Nanoarchaeota archaeon]
MVEDLEGRIKELDALLGNLPANLLFLEKFTMYEESILGHILKEDAEGNIHADKYWGQEYLAPHFRLFTTPVNVLRRETHHLPAIEEKVKAADKSGKTRKRLSYDEELVKALGGLKKVPGHALWMKTRFYEHLFARVRAISDEQNVGPMIVAKNEEGRNEAYRRVFPEPWQYETFSLSLAQNNAIIFHVMSAPAKKQGAPINGLVGRVMHHHDEHDPIRLKANEYIKDQIEYIRARVWQIYAKKPFH